MHDYLTPKEAAAKIGIKYPALLARIRVGKIEAIKRGWALFIHKNEVKRVIKDANSQAMEKSTR